MKTKTILSNGWVILIALCYLSIFAACSSDASPAPNTVSIQQLQPKPAIDRRDMGQSITLDYQIDFYLDQPQEYYYALYKTVSRMTYPIQVQSITSNDLIAQQILQSGSIKALPNSTVKPHQKTLHFDYSYTVDQLPFRIEPGHMTKSVATLNASVKTPIMMDWLSSTHQDTSIIQEIGLIVYTVPLHSDDPQASGAKALQAYTYRKDHHRFDALRFFSSKPYWEHLFKGQQIHVKHTGPSYRFQDYLVYE